MENQATENGFAAEVRGYSAHEGGAQPTGGEARELEVLHVVVGTNLADVERWMIFATLRKCRGNKTRAAALLGVSLKTLYNRLNAYRAQGLAMDYAAADADMVIPKLDGELTEVHL